MRKSTKSKELNTQTDIDQIIAARLDTKNRVKLSATLQKKMNMIDHCDDLIRQYVTRKKVIPMLMNRYEISREYARQLYMETIEIYSTTAQVNKEYWIEYLIERNKKTYDVAYKRGNVTAMAMADNTLAKIVKDILPDDDSSVYEDFQLPAIEVGFYPELLKVDIPENLDEIVRELKSMKKRENGIINSSKAAL